jgi:hypothetical protein
MLDAGRNHKLLQHGAAAAHLGIGKARIKRFHDGPQFGRQLREIEGLKRIGHKARAFV